MKKKKKKLMYVSRVCENLETPISQNTQNTILTTESSSRELRYGVN